VFADYLGNQVPYRGNSSIPHNIQGGQLANAGIDLVKLNAAAKAGTRNFLTNPGFEIYQRGSSWASPAATTYVADRWQYTATGTAVASSVAVDNGVYQARSGASLKVVMGNGTGVGVIRQLLEEAGQISGVQMVFACDV